MDQTKDSDICKNAAAGFSFGKPQNQCSQNTNRPNGFSHTFVPSFGASFIPRKPNPPSVTDAKDYEARLLTFQTWPRSLPVTKQEVCHAGFEYTGESDKVCCVYCGIIIQHFEANDNVWVEHASYSPSCPYLRITCSSSLNEIKKATDNIRSSKGGIPNHFN